MASSTRPAGPAATRPRSTYARPARSSPPHKLPPVSQRTFYRRPIAAGSNPYRDARGPGRDLKWMPRPARARRIYGFQSPQRTFQRSSATLVVSRLNASSSTSFAASREASGAGPQGRA